MNDDEQHLVMLGWGGARLLKREQLLKIEITRVSQGRHIRHAPCARARVNGGSAAPSGDVKSTRLPTLLESSGDRSIDLPYPDLGIGSLLLKPARLMYIPLAAIPHWRQEYAVSLSLFEQ